MQGRLNILGIAAGVCGTAVSLAAFADAAESDVFAKRREWRLVGVEVPDAAMKRTADWKSARFRIVMGHVAPWPCEADLVAPAFKDLLSDETPEGRIHAFVSGHHHAYHRFNPNTRELRFSNRYGDFTKGYPSAVIRKSVANIPARYPYVNLILNAHESMTLDISPERILFRSHRWYKSKGGLYDAFELYPDGTVKEVLDDITVLPLANISPTKTKTEKESV